MTAQIAAQAVLAVLPTIPTGRMTTAPVVSVSTQRVGGVDVPLAVVVRFAAGEQDCRWLGGFAAEVAASPSNWPGRTVALQLTDDLPIVHGSVYGPDTDEPQPED